MQMGLAELVLFLNDKLNEMDECLIHNDVNKATIKVHECLKVIKENTETNTHEK